MNFIKKLFLKKVKKDDDGIQKGVKKNVEHLPVDEVFVRNFVKKGGYFFYPENLDYLEIELRKILKFLNLSSFGVIEPEYKQLLTKLNIPFTAEWQKVNNLLGGCEHLIANEGAILTTEKNSRSWRNQELPKHRIIIALASQIVSHKTEALIKINNNYQKPPANIQTMSIFAKPADGLSVGTWYKTFLFLIEN